MSIAMAQAHLRPAFDLHRQPFVCEMLQRLLIWGRQPTYLKPYRPRKNPFSNHSQTKQSHILAWRKLYVARLEARRDELMAGAPHTPFRFFNAPSRSRPNAASFAQDRARNTQQKIPCRPSSSRACNLIFQPQPSGAFREPGRYLRGSCFMTLTDRKARRPRLEGAYPSPNHNGVRRGRRIFGRYHPLLSWPGRGYIALQQPDSANWTSG